MARILLVLVRVSVLVSSFAIMFGQPADPSYPFLEKAYAALRQADFDKAIRAFGEAVKLAPDRPSIHKDLAYTLLKVGENSAARDHFAAAMLLDPTDSHVALEYAFLCNETKQQAVARRIFLKYRTTDGTAAIAFENIDRPLREGIARWSDVVKKSPGNFSAHEELARLAEQRDETALAAEHYEKAWHLRPDRHDLLLDLGRVWKVQDRTEDANAALLAATRGTEPRVAEQARELLPDRFPYVSEFEKALALDPANVDLRRELAYLELQLNQSERAEQEFAVVVERAPDDLVSVAQLGLLRLARGDRNGAMPLLNRVLAGDNSALADRVRQALEKPQSFRGRPDETHLRVSSEARELAGKSLEKGYLNDVLTYLNVAVENDPVDFASMLKLGWTYNQLKNDREAVRWFSLARKSPDSATSAEAARAYRNLAPSFARFRTTVWAFPTFSTRWHDLFAYAQVKTEFHATGWLLRPYLSARFIGDTHDAVRPGPFSPPQYLSEQSMIAALGVTTLAWRGANAWLEAGEAFRFHPAPLDVSKAKPDYRGGISYAKAFGEGRLLAETNDDLVYVHRFDHDTLFYSQNRLGVKGSRVQVYWNVGITTDLKRQRWANYAETGPGVRFRIAALPFLFSVNALQGTYLDGTGSFHDLRIGLWYAYTR